LENRKLKEVLIKVLHDGQSIDVTASGYSMFPVFFPMDVLRVEPAECFKPGDIVVFDRGDILVAHRLLKIKDGIAFCKGDGLIAADKPMECHLLLGKVVAGKRDGSLIDLNSFRQKWWRIFITKFSIPMGIWIFYFHRIYFKIFKV